MPSSTLIGLDLSGSKFRYVYPAPWLCFSTALDRGGCLSSQTGLVEGVSSVLLLGPEGSKFTHFMSKGPSKTIKNNCHYLEGKTEALELENPKSPRDLVFQIKPLCQLSDSSIAFISRHQVQVLPPRNTPYL